MDKYNKTKEILNFSDAHFEDCMFILNYILDLEKENIMLKHNWNELKKYLEVLKAGFIPIRKYYAELVLSKMQELEEGGNNDC